MFLDEKYFKNMYKEKFILLERGGPRHPGGGAGAGGPPGRRRGGGACLGHPEPVPRLPRPLHRLQPQSGPASEPCKLPFYLLTHSLILLKISS